MTIPAFLRAQAEERELGACVHRFRRRPSIPSTVAVIGLFALVYYVASSPTPANALVIGVFFALPALAWWLVSLIRRREGGLYVFDNGFAVVLGRSVQAVATWADVRDMSEGTRSLVVGLIPVSWIYTCEITLRDKKTVTLNTTYHGLFKATDIIKQHVSPWP